MPPTPTPSWYNERPALYDGSVSVTFESSTPPSANVEEIGDGDYSLNVGELFESDFLQISLANIQPNDNVAIVFSSIEGLSHGAVRSISGSGASNLVGDSEAITGSGMYWDVPVSKIGCVAVVVNGEFFARVALYNSITTVEDCLALPLPLFAYREGEAVQPISIEPISPQEIVAGWEIYSPYQPTRIVGFNLPTSLKYTVGILETGFTAAGGDYGIEFTTPQEATKITIFDESFWLYLH